MPEPSLFHEEADPVGHADRPRYVHAGEVALGTAEDELRTVLGSCVAVTLWHPERRIGVMSHVLLPRQQHAPGYGSSSGGDARYASGSLQKMLGLLRTKGIPPADCICKIFGGARVFAGNSHGVGSANVRELRRLLDRAGVHVSNESVEGTGHRLLRFVIATGDVWVRHRRGQIVAPRQSPERPARIGHR